MQKGNILLVVLLLVLVVGVSGYFVYTKGYLKPKQIATNSVFNYGSTSIVMSATGDESGEVSSDAIKLSITSPKNGSTLTSNSVTIKGITSPNAEVFINDASTKADANGNFSLTLTLDEGQNGLVITANDDSGNVVEQDLSVNIQSF